MTARIFKIDERPVTKTDWGDYGHILQHGMCSHLSRTDDLLQLERTGPYIPPITLPGIGEVVLTSPARQLLESSKLTGFSFRPVKKALTLNCIGRLGIGRRMNPNNFQNPASRKTTFLGNRAVRALQRHWAIFGSCLSGRRRLFCAPRQS